MGFLADMKRAIYNIVNLDELLSNNGIRQRMEQAAKRRDYYAGNHPKQLRTKEGQADDNLVVNFAGLVVKRTVSLLLGNGIEFDMPGDPIETQGENGKTVKEDQPNQQYIDSVWDANNQDILLHKIAQFGAIHGTCYVKLVPDGAESRADENVMLPRLIALDPTYMEIESMPEDIDTVLRYTMRWSVNIGGKPRGRKEVTERAQVMVDADGNPTNDPKQIAGFMDNGWTVTEYTESDTGRYEVTGVQPWDYEFPPIVHWQNLPLAGAVYGEPDVTDDVIELQDRINFVASNISKIIRYHSHPKTWGRGANLGDKASWGADEMVMLQGPDAMLQNLEMQSDLASSQNFLLVLRQALFDISRTVDIASMADKLGALTNFGLRVLFLDAIAKLNSKQQLYGEALREINHRLLVLSGQSYPDMDGGEVVWPDVLPTNETEEVAGLTFDLDQGLVSKETASTIRGYDYEKEQERIDAEAQNANANNGNIGAAILAAFNRGGENNAIPQQGTEGVPLRQTPENRPTLGA